MPKRERLTDQSTIMHRRAIGRRHGAHINSIAVRMPGSNLDSLMSALGQKRTFSSAWPMSALPPKADIGTGSHINFERYLRPGVTLLASRHVLTRSGRMRTTRPPSLAVLLSSTRSAVLTRIYCTWPWFNIQAPYLAALVVSQSLSLHFSTSVLHS